MVLPNIPFELNASENFSVSQQLKRLRSALKLVTRLRC